MAMARKPLWILLAALAGLLIAVSATQAQVRSTNLRPQERAAATTPVAGSPGALFGCQAGVAPVYAGSSTAPLIDVGEANPGLNPCVNSQSTVQPVDLNLQSLGQDLGSVGPAGAYTDAEGQAQSLTPPAVSAVANVQAVNLNLGSSGTLTIGGPVQADASYACVNNQLQATGQSTLDVLYVNGQKDQLPAAGTPTTIQLGGGAYIAVNEQIKTATSLIENILDIHLANGTQVIVGQAEVTAHSTAACANTAPPNGVVNCTLTNGCSPFPLICPNGSTIDNAKAACVIVLSNGTVIYVSKPFQGPNGGTVYALPVARKKFHGPCLYGPGPKYVFVVSKVGGHAIGTVKSDRILGIGARERIAGLGGNDCIDEQGSSSKAYDGNGKDRIWVHAGRNRVAIGNGNSKIYGGSGSDWITAGNGNDRIIGGQGASRIDVGIGRNVIFGGHSPNRIFAAGDNSRVSCGSSHHNVLYARSKAAQFGRSHGCTKVVILR